jgi:BirA family biotin operon repressor/biotin-[acetyl-CoA-carboxylase] ligase
MPTLPLTNPFGAPVYYYETLSSTMDEGRRLAARGAPPGTVAAADYQEAGRGRIRTRPWKMDAGKNLSFTILLRCPGGVPEALTLRTGLALALAAEDFAPALKCRVEIKWPNDLMIDRRKAGGILTEGDGSAVFIGIGGNVAQTGFPPEVRAKATSIALALGDPAALAEDRFRLLELILARLYAELNQGRPWREGLEERLYRKGEQVTFIDGAAGSDSAVEGRLAGIGPAGELLIVPQGEEKARSFITGELRVY